MPTPPRHLARTRSTCAQFRFLWRLFDRDCDGALSKDDMREVLKLPAARLGWSDAMHAKWTQWAFDRIMPKDKQGRVSPSALKATLRASSTLRAVLMAREPAVSGAMARQPSGGMAGVDSSRPEWMPEWMMP